MAASTEEPNGSPLVRERLMSYTMKHLVVLRKMQVTNDERISGMVTCHIAWRDEQPSMSAASLRLASTLMKPAM